MKVIPIATNRIFLELDNGEVLDVNDGTLVPSGGVLSVSLSHPTGCYLICEQEADNIRITMPNLRRLK